VGEGKSYRVVEIIPKKFHEPFSGRKGRLNPGCMTGVNKGTPFLGR